MKGEERRGVICNTPSLGIYEEEKKKSKSSANTTKYGESFNGRAGKENAKPLRTSDVSSEASEEVVGRRRMQSRKSRQ